MNKNLMIGLGVLAVAGIAYYMYKKPKATSNVSTKSGETSSNARGFEETEEVSNPLSSGKVKVGDTWFDYDNKECCFVQSDYTIKCTPAPCSLGAF